MFKFFKKIFNINDGKKSEKKSKKEKPLKGQIQTSSVYTKPAVAPHLTSSTYVSLPHIKDTASPYTTYTYKTYTEPGPTTYKKSKPIKPIKKSNPTYTSCGHDFGSHDFGGNDCGGF